VKHFHVLARSVAATAVAGIALIGMSGAAGATSISISVPPLLSGNGSGEPIVTAGNGTVAPVPGLNATVPVHAEGHVPSSHHATSGVSVPVNDPTGVTKHIAAVRGQSVWIDACLAAAVLSNRSTSACPNAFGGVASSLPAAISGFGAPAGLPQALANVGGCVKVALESGAPIDTCTTPASIDPGSITRAVPGAPSIPSSGLGSLPTGDVGSLPTGDLGSLPTGDVGSLPAELGTLPAALGTLPSTAALDNGTVAHELANVGLCPIARQLGVASLLSCANSASAPSVPVGTAGNPLNPGDLCLGLAAVINVDGSRCANAPSTPAAHARATVKARHDGGKATVHSNAPAAQFNSSCTSSIGHASSSSSPFSPTTAGGFAGLGFAIAAISKGLRRLRRPVLA
jgi:hypothetical protein